MTDEEKKKFVDEILNEIERRKNLKNGNMDESHKR